MSPFVPVEGGTYLDCPTNADYVWYNPYIIANLPDAPIDSIPISMSDRPYGPFSDTPVLSSGAQQNVPITTGSLIWQFSLYVAAATNDAANDAGLYYVQLARANWQFDGSGSLANAGPGTYGTWQQTGSGVSGDTGFTSVSSGSAVPTDGVGANEELEDLSWATEPPF